RDSYYSDAWQVVEVRKDGDADPLKQFIWDQRYVDSPVVRFHDGDTDGTIDDTLYYTTDANFNVTALLNASGAVVERYAYDPYGAVTVLDADWSSDADGASDVDNHTLYAGYHFDSETGLYHVRNRMYHPTLGRWMQRDPIGYVDGMSLYGYVGASTATRVDPLGLGWLSDIGNGISWAAGQAAAKAREWVTHAAGKIVMATWKPLAKVLGSLTGLPMPQPPGTVGLKADWAKMYEAWFFETTPALNGAKWIGNSKTVFSKDSLYSTDIVGSPSWAEIRRDFKKRVVDAGTKERSGTTKLQWAFTGSKTREAGLTTVEWFIGSYEANIRWTRISVCEYKIKATITNTSGWHSGTRLPKTWRDKIKQHTGIDIVSINGGAQNDCKRGECDDGLKAFLISQVVNIVSSNVPGWVSSRIDVKGTAQWAVGGMVNALPIPSFGGKWDQEFQVEDTWCFDEPTTKPAESGK
ncbi:MAG: RHS repeat-associated core domain-containing protein, partial [Planctomycetes bacterium]|nr:RHS repeat-associated core domain-containing protein [Planctomycetota bacterium]